MKTMAISGAFAVAAVALGADLAAAGTRNFTANLVPVQEFVSPEARGQAKLELSSDGSELRFRLTVKSLEAVTQAHIHLTSDALKVQSPLDRFKKPLSKDEHGPITAFLMKFQRKGITVDGVLAEGTITASDLVGHLKGYPLSLLADLMERGDAYIALHVIKPLPPSGEFCCPVGLRGIIEAKLSQ